MNVRLVVGSDAQLANISISFLALWHTLPELIIASKRYNDSLLCEFSSVSESAVVTSRHLSSLPLFRAQKIL